MTLAWFDEHFGFEGGHLTQVSRSTDGDVTLVLEQYSEQDHAPGGVCVVEVHELLASGVTEFFCAEPPEPTHALEEIDVAEVDGQLHLEAFAPTRVRFVAAAFTTRLLRTEQRLTEPRISDRSFSFTPTSRPDAETWRHHVTEILGRSVTWRVLGGGPGTPTDLNGWFLQEIAELENSDYGALCLVHRYMTFERHSTSDDLWRAVQLAAASHASELRSGLLVLTPAQWTRYLRTGELPT